jgi:hypothetical protein
LGGFVKVSRAVGKVGLENKFSGAVLGATFKQGLSMSFSSIVLSCIGQSLAIV